jgi:tetratricopeptide (TPR) repeat protein
MRSSLTLIALACAALTSCTAPQHATPQQAVASADAYYALGRSYYAEARPQDAQRAYMLALQRDPAHADARNGLAVLFAERGDEAQAIAIWRKLAEEERAPHDQALVLGNLGNALGRHGDKEEALYLLQKAAVLDPANADNWQRLGAALKAAGEPERAGVMLRQADTLREHDIKADYALVAGAAKAVPEPALHLEISNGNGVRGMAADWARKLRGSEWKSLRVTNSRPFLVARTRVEFAPQRETAAQELAKRFGGAALLEVKTLTDLRVVLGHDQRPQKQMPAQGGHHAL